MEGVGFRVRGLAGVARRALAVVEPAIEGVAEDVAVALAVRVVAVDTGHRAEEVARAGAVGLLVAERGDPAIGQVRRVADEGEAETVFLRAVARIVPERALAALGSG